MTIQTTPTNLLDGALVYEARLQPHPLAEFYPMQDPARYGELVDGMKKSGYRNEFPVVVYEGKILDGRNRYRAAMELGIEPYMVPFSGDDPVDFVIQANSNRRDLEPEQRYIIQKKIMASIWAQKAKENMRAGGQAHTGNQYAPKMEGLPQVANLPLEEKSGRMGLVNLPNLARGADSVKSSKAPRVTYGPDEDDYQEDYGGAEIEPKKVNTRAEIAQSVGVSNGTASKIEYVEKRAPDLYEKMERGELKATQAVKEVKARERQSARAELAAVGAQVPQSERWNIWQADIRTWQAPRQYDFIITDPPYPKEYLPLWEVLAQRAAEWLKPGGLLIAMSGQSYLDEIYPMLGKHLTYWWTGAYLTPGGQSAQVFPRKVLPYWKPLLIYARGDYTGKWFGDVSKSDENSKDFHEWGQSVSGMKDVIGRFAEPGNYILDPFCGASTTGLAALEFGCFFDGIDIDENVVNISKGRLSNA